VVGITPAELESFNELIKFDHMYYRQPSTDDSAVLSINQPELTSVAAFEQTSDVALEEELTGSSFTSSDLMQLNLDWLINNDVLAESKSNVDVEPTHLTMDDFGVTPVDPNYFTNDLLIPANQLDCTFSKEKPDTYFELTDDDNLSIDHLLEDLGLIVDRRHEMTNTDVSGLVENDSMQVETFDRGDSLKNKCLSPSSSSGYDSDFRSTCDDDQFSFSDEVCFGNLSEEPFTELFPALY